MANLTPKFTESEVEALGKILTKKIGALEWVLENKDPKEPKKLEENIEELKGIQKKLK